MSVAALAGRPQRGGAVVDLLVDEGLLRDRTAPRVLRLGRSPVMQFLGAEPMVVKVLDAEPGAREVAALTQLAAFAVAPRLIAALPWRESLVVVSEHVDARPLTASPPADERAVIAGWLERVAAASEPVPLRPTRSDLAALLAGLELSPAAGWWWSERLELLPAWVRPAAQHGDLCRLNLGLRTDRAGTLATAWDWEDYGRVTWPAFDLGVLLLDLSGNLDGEATSANALAAELHRWEPVAEALAGSAARLRQLLAIHLLAFTWLKNVGVYGSSVRQQARRRLEEVARGAWEEILDE